MTWISQPAAVSVSPGERPSSPRRNAGSAARTGAPVSAANAAAPSEWSGWPWVSRIWATRWPAGGDLVTDAVQVARVGGARIDHHRPG